MPQETESVKFHKRWVAAGERIAARRLALLPPPPAPALPPIRHDMVLGRDIHSKIEVVLHPDERFRHLFCVGITGSGKTNFLLSQVLQDLRAGRGVVVFDPLGNFADSILYHLPEGRADDTYLLDLDDVDFPYGVNVFDSRLSAGEINAVFQKVWGGDWGPLIDTWLSVIHKTFQQSGGGLMTDIPRLIADPAYRVRRVGVMTDEFARAYWGQATGKDGKIASTEIGSTFRRIGKFLMNPVLANIVGQETTIDFAEIIGRGECLIVKLPTMKDAETARIVGTVLYQLFVAAAGGRRDRTPLFFYADEFQEIATSDIRRIVNLLRQYKIGAVFATQQLINIPDEEVRKVVMGTGTRLVFEVTGTDASAMARGIGTRPSGDIYDEQGLLIKPTRAEVADELTRLTEIGGVGTAVAKTPHAVATIRPPLIQTPDPVPHTRLRGHIVSRSRARFCRERIDVEEERRERAKGEIPTVFLDQPPPSRGF